MDLLSDTDATSEFKSYVSQIRRALDVIEK
jgi:hypothetical protein